MLGLSRTFSLPLKAGVREGELLRERALQPEGADDPRDEPGMNCIKIGLPGKLILSKRKGLRVVLFS